MDNVYNEPDNDTTGRLGEATTPVVSLLCLSLIPLIYLLGRFLRYLLG